VNKCPGLPNEDRDLVSAPRAVRDHLVERMHDRNIGLEDLNQLRLWMESKPDVPDGLPEGKSFNACARLPTFT